MHRLRRDRVARSVFAAAIIAAHLLLVYLLAAPLRHYTTPISGAGESVLLLMPDRSGTIWCAHAGSVRPGTVVLQVSR